MAASLRGPHAGLSGLPKETVSRTPTGETVLLGLGEGGACSLTGVSDPAWLSGGPAWDTCPCHGSDLPALAPTDTDRIRVRRKPWSGGRWPALACIPGWLCAPAWAASPVQASVASQGEPCSAGMKGEGSSRNTRSCQGRARNLPISTLGHPHLSRQQRKSKKRERVPLGPWGPESMLSPLPHCWAP